MLAILTEITFYHCMTLYAVNIITKISDDIIFVRRSISFTKSEKIFSVSLHSIHLVLGRTEMYKIIYAIVLLHDDCMQPL